MIVNPSWPRFMAISRYKEAIVLFHPGRPKVKRMKACYTTTTQLNTIMKQKNFHIHTGTTIRKILPMTGVLLVI